MMQNRCNTYHVIGGSCSCGWYYDSNSNNNPNNSSFSMMFSPVHHDYNNTGYVDHEETDMYQYQYQYQYASSSSPPSSVDCTLSLGTPSTRLSNTRDNNDNHHHVISEKKKPKFFSWNFLQPSSNSKSHDHHSSSKSTTNRTASNYSNSYSGSGNNGGDSGSARRCANCDTSSTPLWRNGPKGPKSLCNACGIRYKKEEKRAAAAAAANNNSDNGVGDAAHHVLNSSPWVHHSQNQMMPCVSSVYSNEFSFIEDIDDSGNPFLFRRLNVH